MVRITDEYMFVLLAVMYDSWRGKNKVCTQQPINGNNFFPAWSSLVIVQGVTDKQLIGLPSLTLNNSVKKN